MKYCRVLISTVNSVLSWQTKAKTTLKILFFLLYEFLSFLYFHLYVLTIFLTNQNFIFIFSILFFLLQLLTKQNFLLIPFLQFLGNQTLIQSKNQTKIFYNQIFQHHKSTTELKCHYASLQVHVKNTHFTTLITQHKQTQSQAIVV